MIKENYYYYYSTLLSTETSYSDDVRMQQDERRSDVQKSKRIKTVKLAKNVKITQEHLSMRQPQATPPAPVAVFYSWIILVAFYSAMNSPVCQLKSTQLNRELRTQVSDTSKSAS